jgi:hypothetical protein
MPKPRNDPAAAIPPSVPRRAKNLGYFIKLVGGAGGVRAGRWFYGHVADTAWQPSGDGYKRQGDAWKAALDHHKAAG